MIIKEGNLLPVIIPVSNPRATLVKVSNRPVSLVFAPLSSNHRIRKLSANSKPLRILCLGGSQDQPKYDDKGPAWNSLGKVLGSFGGRSVEDVLREQIAKQKYYDGGSGRKPPGGGNGGSASGDSDNSSNADFLDEAVQVMLATMGFLIMYIYIICGPELTRLVRDYIKFLNGGGQSVRLKKAISWWRSLYNLLTRRKKVDDMWLENQIVDTTTWFDSPDKYRLMKSDLAANGND